MTQNQATPGTIPTAAPPALPPALDAQWARLEKARDQLAGKTPVNTPVESAPAADTDMVRAIALKPLPWLNAAPGATFTTTRKNLEHLTRQKLAKPTPDDVWLATLHEGGIVVGDLTDKSATHFIVTRAEPRLVPFDVAVAAVARCDNPGGLTFPGGGLLSFGAPGRYAGSVKIITADEAADYDPHSLPPDPRPNYFLQRPSVFDSPSIEVRANFTGNWANLGSVREGSEYRHPIVIALVGTYRLVEHRDPPTPKFTILEGLDAFGQLLQVAIEEHIKRHPNDWQMGDIDFPDWSSIRTLALQHERQSA